MNRREMLIATSGLLAGGSIAGAENFKIIDER